MADQSPSAPVEAPPPSEDFETAREAWNEYIVGNVRVRIKVVPLAIWRVKDAAGNVQQTADGSPHVNVRLSTLITAEVLDGM